MTTHSIEEPGQLNAILTDAFQRGDLERLVSVYDDDAVLLVPPDGHAARGRKEIRAAVAPLVALRPRFSSAVRRTLQAGGLALTHAEWRMALTEADGSNRELRGHGTIVSRRGPRGDWRIVLDDPLGPAPIDAGPAPEAGHG